MEPQNRPGGHATGLPVVGGSKHPGGAAIDIAVRVLSMERVHRATPPTTGRCVAAACLIPGTLANSYAGASL
ncbi:MAG: hypothetical protein GKR94_28370 [Gammaproteobacteria bacterium]|nr:hypothetical protein [Gammaproteobacteria bacterium]